MTKLTNAERKARPFAIYGLVSFPLLMVSAIWLTLSPSAATWIDRTLNAALPVTEMCAVTAVLSMLVAFIAAIRIVAQDPAITAEARFRWTLALVFTNLLGGCVFLVWRAWKESLRDRLSKPIS